MLNSSPFNYAVQSYSQKGGKSFGTPSILENVRIPGFDKANRIHIQLAELSSKAHSATTQGDTESIEHIEAQVDLLAAKVWGLSQSELNEIHQSLAELG